jgi:hypothetical protein
VAIDRWLADEYQAVQKKSRGDRAHLVPIDETGLFLNPTVRRSWTPVGRTPVIGGDGGHRTKVSVIGAVTVSPRAHRLGFYFATAVSGYFSARRWARSCGTYPTRWSSSGTAEAITRGR